jgi:hypothetical protein
MASAYILKNLPKLIGSTTVTIEGELYESEPGNPAVAITFSEGTRLRTDYWRLIKNKKASISSFDHQQKYGLPSPIDAVDTLRRELQGKAVTAVRFDEETGDLQFDFANDTKLQALNFTGYEIWHISFPDGTGEYSNYALA